MTASNKCAVCKHRQSIHGVRRPCLALGCPCPGYRSQAAPSDWARYLASVGFGVDFVTTVPLPLPLFADLVIAWAEDQGESAQIWQTVLETEGMIVGTE